MPQHSVPTGVLINNWNRNPAAGAFQASEFSGPGQPAPWFLNPAYSAVLEDDFFGPLNTTLWTARTTTTLGTPTTTAQSLASGVVRFALDSDNEAEVHGVDMADVLQIDPAKRGFIVFGFKVPTLLAANQHVYCGVGTAYNATFASITRRAYFHVEGGASTNSIYVGTDNNVTDTGDVDTTQDATADTYIRAAISFEGANNLRFILNGAEVATSTTLAIGSGVVQPFIFVTKTTGTGTPSLDVDFISYRAIKDQTKVL